MLQPRTTPEPSLRLIGRRLFITAAAGTAAGLILRHYGIASMQAKAAGPAAPKVVTIVEFTDAGVRKGTVTVPKIVKTDSEWKQQLSPDSFEVTRHAETERAFTGALLNEHDKGVFRCICCDTALFGSTA